MIDTPKKPTAVAPHWFVRSSASVAMLVGALVLVGRMFDLPVLTDLVSQELSIKVNTALCFSLCGAALWLLQMPGRAAGRLARACTILLGAIALHRLLEQATGWDLGTHQFLLRVQNPGTSGSSMAASASLCFALLAGGLWLMNRPPGKSCRPWISVSIASYVVLIGLMAQFAQFGQFNLSFRWMDFAGMAMLTASLLVLLGAGLFAVAWREAGARWLIKPWITVGLGFGLVLLVATASYSHRSTKELVEAAARVSHSHEVLVKLGELRSSLDEHQSGTRGYVITGNESFLSLAQNAIPQVRKQVRELLSLTSDNLAQQRRITRLQKQIDELQLWVSQVVELRRTSGFDEAEVEVASGKGKKMMDEIRTQLVEMTTDEDGLLQERAARSRIIADRTFSILPIGIVLSLVFLMSGVLRLNRVMVERQRAAEALRVNEEFVRGVLDSLPAHVAVLNERGVVLAVNEPWNRFAAENDGAADSVSNGANYLEVCQGAAAEGDTYAREALAGLEAVLGGNVAGYVMEYPCHAPDRERWFLMHIERVSRGCGGAIISHLDITPRKQAEHALRNSEDRYRTLFSSIDEGFCVIEMVFDAHQKPVDYRFLEVNPAFETETGMRNATGKRMRELVPKHEDYWFEIYGRVAITGEAVRFTNEAKGLGGRWFDVYAFPLGGRGSSKVAITFSDITARKHADEALRESVAGERARRAELEALMDALPVAIFISRDSASEHMTGNRAAEELLRLPQGGNPSLSSPEAERPDFQVWAEGRRLTPEELPMQRSAATGVAVSDAEIEIVFPDGEKRDLLGSAFPLFDDSGMVRGCIGAFVDITLRKRREHNVAFLAEMQHSLTSISSPPEIMRLKGRQIAEHLRLDHCLFVEINEAAEEATVLHDHHATDMPSLEGVYRLKDFHTEAELRKMAAGGAMVIDDVSQTPGAAAYAALGIGSLLSTNYVVGGRWKFMLSAIRHEPGVWSPEDIGLLVELAERIYLRIERARAVERLAESETRFRSIFHDAAVPMEVSLPDGRFAQVNRAFCEMLGYSERELLALTFEAVTHPEDRVTLALKPMRELMDGTITSFRTEKRYLRRDGEVVWVDLSVSIVRGVDGKPAYFISQIQDITGRKSAEDSLRKSENMLALAVEAGQLGVWNWDQPTRTLTWSERCNEMNGLPRGSKISQLVAMGTIHPDDRGRVHDEATVALKDKVDMDLEYRTLWSDGTVRWLQTRGRAFHDAAGGLVRITGITQDVTGRRESEDTLRRFNTQLEALVEERTEVIKLTMKELQREFAERRRLEEEILEIGERAQARIGQDLHDELGQQLVGMTILMGLLSGQLAAESHPQADEAAKLQTFLSGLINTTRNLAKSLYPVELERGGLNLSLQELAYRTEMLAGVSCKVNTEDGFRFEKAAEIHLYRIVQESISNALKHGKARHITIDCTVLDGVSTLTVTDDGSGFEPSEMVKWAGIGLHLFQYRARLMGARLTVIRGENGGCQVRCSIGGSETAGKQFG